MQEDKRLSDCKDEFLLYACVKLGAFLIVCFTTGVCRTVVYIRYSYIMIDSSEKTHRPAYLSTSEMAAMHIIQNCMHAQLSATEDTHFLQHKTTHAQTTV